MSETHYILVQCIMMTQVICCMVVGRQVGAILINLSSCQNTAVVLLACNVNTAHYNIALPLPVLVQGGLSEPSGFFAKVQKFCAAFAVHEGSQP